MDFGGVIYSSLASLMIETNHGHHSSSESKVINLCSEHLGIAIEPTQIERAHRLGQFNREKNRPIIAKYTFFKDKQSIIENGYKFKGTDFAVREDFSLQTRIARRKLIAFAKTRGVPLKLTLDTLRVDNTTYRYDSPSDSVVPLSR